MSLIQRSVWEPAFPAFTVWKRHIGKDYIKNWVAVIGDSTFMHTGVNSLINMVYNQGTGTVIIMDNSTTGMTGHQDHAATGKTLQGRGSAGNQHLQLV